MKKRKLLKRCKHCKNTGFSVNIMYHWHMPQGIMIDRCGWCVHGSRKRLKTLQKKREELLKTALKLTGREVV